MKRNNYYMKLSIGFGILVIATLLTYILKAIAEYNKLQKPPDIQQSFIDSINPILKHF